MTWFKLLGKRYSAESRDNGLSACLCFGVAMGIILIVLLILLLVGAFPTWPHSKNWGPYPSGGIGLALVILIVLLLLGRI